MPFNAAQEPVSNPTNTISHKAAELIAQPQATNKAEQTSHQASDQHPIRDFWHLNANEIIVTIVAALIVALIVGSWNRILDYFIIKPRQRRLDAETARRQEAYRLAVAQKERDKMIADFDFVMEKWLRRINGPETKLAELRRDSLNEIEASIKAVVVILDAPRKDVLHAEWEKYNRMGGYDFFNGDRKIDPLTGSSYICYNRVRKALSEPLEAIKKIVHSATIDTQI
jgi:hypothetical protein